MKDANVSKTGKTYLRVYSYVKFINWRYILGDHVVLMGAASKGIIQRGYQHNATVYKTPYAKNPFESVTDDELKEYKRTVDKKRAGDCKF